MRRSKKYFITDFKILNIFLKKLNIDNVGMCLENSHEKRNMEATENCKNKKPAK